MMRQSPGKLLTALAPLLAVPLAGGQASAQVAAEETFHLAQVSGQALPVVTEENGDCRDELGAATLTLHTDGRWTLTTTEREVCAGATEEEEDREEGRYTIEGETIRFSDEEGDTPEDDGDDTELEVDDLVQGTRSADGLTVRVADGETELQFRR